MKFSKVASLVKDILYISKLTKIKNKKRTLIISILLSNITVFLDLLIITVFASVFTRIQPNNLITEYVVQNKFILPIIVLIRYISVYFEKIIVFKLQLNVNESLRRFLLNDIYNKGNYSISDASFFLTQLTEHVSQFYGAVALLLSTVLQLVIYLFFLIYSDYQAIMYFLLFSLFLLPPSIKILKISRDYTDKYFNYGQKIVRDIQKVIDNLFLIKIYDTKDEEFKSFDSKLKSFTNYKFLNYKYSTINFLIPNFSVVLLLSILISISYLVVNISLDFLGVLLRLVQTLGIINNNLNLLINSHVHLEKFSEIEKNKFVNTSVELQNLKDPKYIIQLENVSFKYFGAADFTYENLNLNILKNKHTIITGKNGSGKSTLLGIISGVFIPNSGVVRRSSLKMGYVGATPLIIEGTLKQNLLYGNTSQSNNELLLKVVNEIKLFQNKVTDLDIIINNKSLSSGQMQKISFLRAFLANVQILFLDESTSNLDDESKKHIRKFLDEKEVTILNCTHNPEDFNYDYKIEIKKNGLNSQVVFN